MYDWEVPDSAINVWVRLRQACQALERAVRGELEVYETSLPQIDMLMLLSVTDGPISESEIASHLFRERHSVSGLVARMEKTGYVRKVKSAGDQRVVRVEIQPKGEQLLSQALGACTPYARRIVKASLPDEEIDRLDGLLGRLRDGVLAWTGSEAESLPDTIDAVRLLDRPNGM